MFKSDSEIKELLEHSNNSVRVAIIGQGQDDRSDRTPKSGKREHLSTEDKTKIALLASVIGVKPAAELVSKTSGVVGRIAAGEKSNGDPDLELKEKIDDKKNRIQNKSLDLAERFLEMLGVSDSTEAVKVATTAEKVVNIFEKLAPKEKGLVNNTQIVFYAPRIKESQDYQIIEVEAQNG